MLQVETGRNLTAALYSETQKSETFFDEINTMKNAKLTK